MKTTGKCPKCGSREIYVIDGRDKLSAYGANFIRMGLFGWYIYIQRLICINCGYTEEWINKVDLETIKNSHRVYKLNYNREEKQD